MTKEKNVFEIAQRAVLYDRSSKKFLLMKYKEDTTWSLPGGRMNNGENPLEALEREIDEELGEIDYEVIKTIDAHSSDDTFRIGYLVFYKDGEITLSDEHEEFAWLTKEEIEKEEEKSFHRGVRQFIRSATQAIISDEYLNDLKRLQADFENYKKRMENERKETMRFITTGIISDLVPILDNFNMAVAHVPEDKKSDPWVTGITYIERQFEEVIAGYGVDIMEVKVGDTFDPTRHEAVGSEAKNEESGIENQDETKEKEQKIAKVLQKGYLMGDKVIRAAKVTVS
jgi:molecular chaperone GrpE